MKEEKYLNEGNIYPVTTLLEKFPKIFGMTANEMMALFLKTSLINEEEVKQYITSHSKAQDEEEIRKILTSRMEGSYYVFQTQLAILANKGKVYLSLLQYVANSDINHKDDLYEQLLQQMGLDHYCQCMTVKNLNKILLPLSYIIQSMKAILKRANCFKTYQSEVYDSFARSFSEDKIYPEDCIISSRDYHKDKTTFCKQECKVLKRII